MNNSKDTLAYFIKKLGNSTRISTRTEQGECTLYADGKPVALICDDLLYIPVCGASMPLENICDKGFPYLGAKQHYVINEEQLALIPTLPKILFAIAQSL